MSFFDTCPTVLTFPALAAIYSALLIAQIVLLSMNNLLIFVFIDIQPPTIGIVVRLISRFNLPCLF